MMPYYAIGFAFVLDGHESFVISFLSWFSANLTENSNGIPLAVWLNVRNLSNVGKSIWLRIL